MQPMNAALWFCFFAYDWPADVISIDVHSFRDWRPFGRGRHMMLLRTPIHSGIALSLSSFATPTNNTLGHGLFNLSLQPIDKGPDEETLHFQCQFDDVT